MAYALSLWVSVTVKTVLWVKLPLRQMRARSKQVQMNRRLPIKIAKIKIKEGSSCMNCNFERLLYNRLVMKACELAIAWSYSLIFVYELSPHFYLTSQNQTIFSVLYNTLGDSKFVYMTKWFCLYVMNNVKITHMPNNTSRNLLKC